MQLNGDVVEVKRGCWFFLLKRPLTRTSKFTFFLIYFYFCHFVYTWEMLHFCHHRLACSYMANSTIKIFSEDISEMLPVNVEMLEHDDGEFQLVNKNLNMARTSASLDFLLKRAAETGDNAFYIF